MKSFWERHKDNIVGVAVTLICVAFTVFIVWLLFYGGMVQLVCGDGPCPTPPPAPTTTPYPTVTPRPDAQLLDCKIVQIDGQAVTMRLCRMPDGMTCLFEEKKPTTCYSMPGGDR